MAACRATRELLHEAICTELGYDANITLENALSQAARDLRRQKMLFCTVHMFIHAVDNIKLKRTCISCRA